jgi:predicted nucleic acid-binding protein
MRVLIDSNVLLDVLTIREPFYNDSAVIWSLVEEKKIDGFISAISVNNIYYITKKLTDKKTAGSLVDKILKDFSVIALNFEILKLARSKDGDYEDLIQYFSALQNSCDYIITRDLKGFPGKGIKVIDPKGFIGLMTS